MCQYLSKLNALFIFGGGGGGGGGGGYLYKHCVIYIFTAAFLRCFYSERFCAITPIDLLEKVNLIPKRSSKVIVQRDSRVSNHSGQSLSLSFSDIEQQETNIEKLAYRFNQVNNAVMHDCKFLS